MVSRLRLSLGLDCGGGAFTRKIHHFAGEVWARSHSAFGFGPAPAGIFGRVRWQHCGSRTFRDFQVHIYMPHIEARYSNQSFRKINILEKLLRDGSQDVATA